MKISKLEKEKQRAKILKSVMPAFKKSGLHAAPVSDVMKKVGLTTGALYGNFESKDDLFIQASLNEADALIEKIRGFNEKYGANGLKEYIKVYCSDEHVTGVATGCQFIALSGDLQRLEDKARSQFNERLDDLFKAMAEGMPKGTPSERLEKAKLIYATAVGTLIFARIYTNEDSSADFLTISKKRINRLIAE